MFPLPRSGGSGRDVLAAIRSLTECEAFEPVAGAWGNQDIAGRLPICPCTVKVHVSLW
ncbi:hypothetical protein [Streptoalloteichus hindustanus]|uniref:Uncharacterized protein n=1 Tax=Streptoalloteichus hindustanus TaxID=2017 RepID=A0A1M5NBP0_STRHI|nr:hypothetical protein [Streptoalloteichus hindustanus]SHG87036.1 hypothetical protein SAMN05444320_11580 [Streptoalloteichus hindustanus]